MSILKVYLYMFCNMRVYLFVNLKISMISRYYFAIFHVNICGAVMLHNKMISSFDLLKQFIIVSPSSCIECKRETGVYNLAHIPFLQNSTYV